MQTVKVEEALTEDAPAIVGNLIDKYVDRERVTFIGSYLRMFTDSPVLICGWLSIENMKKLFQTIKSEDFNVQSDAIETTQVSEDKPSLSLTRSFPFSNCLAPRPEPTTVK